jgi:D-alanyl-D-alanine carboxypeptidase/D-alanyl-D-alanine-endopeptidase (penicillin-binding protein 4)
MSILLFALLALSNPPSAITASIAAQGLPSASVSFIVVDALTGRTVISQNAATPRSPASTLKTITTYASLDLLGPAYVWHTKALIRGKLEDGVLDGDLILQGGGDPYMTLERWWNFTRQVRAAGIKAIRGDIVIDRSAFDLGVQDPGAFDGQPNRAYNVLPDALMINFQSVDFHVSVNAENRRVEFTAAPHPANLLIENHVHFGGTGCHVEAEIGGEHWERAVLNGNMAASCAPLDVTRVVLSPSEYAYGSFLSLWHELGGSFEGKLRVEAAPPDARLVLSFDSLSLGEIVRLTNKYSNNLMARHLLLTLGQEHAGAPATVAKGAQAISAWGMARGLDLQDLIIDNGAGLSRAAQVSVATMAGVLGAAYRSPYAPEFLASLPLAGLDGTLRTRMQTTPGGSARLKTGHIDGVSGVAGYVTGADGRTYVLVSLINDARLDGGAGEPVHEALVKWILDYRSTEP